MSKKAQELLKELHSKDIRTLMELNIDHVEVYEALAELEQDPQMLIRQLFTDLAMQEEIIKNQKKQVNKARSIVAMLFWDMKYCKRKYLTHKSRSDKIGWGLYEQAILSNRYFKEAYKILKDNA